MSMQCKMGRTRERKPRSYTLPSSPTHSSSSSDFEFTIALSPRSRNKVTTNNSLCPADELFYKGQLLPLHHSPRLSMVRTLLLASSSTSSSSDTTTARDSSGSSNDSYSSGGDLLLLPEGRECDSSRPSSVTEEDELKRLHNNSNVKKGGNKYLNFSLSRFSSVFRKEPNKNRHHDVHHDGGISGPLSAPSSVKRMSTSARDVIRKYLKKVKPLYEKISQKSSAQPSNVTLFMKKRENGYSAIQKSMMVKESSQNATISHSFSGNLRYPRKNKSYVSSCPSSMRSSPSHSGILSRSGFGVTTNSYSPTCRSGFATPTNKMGIYSSNSSTMEELQNAIQGAIAHCKNSMLQDHNTTTKKNVVSTEII